MSLFRLAAAVFAVAAGTGCVSTQRLGPKPDAGDSAPPAEALARFASGMAHEMAGRRDEAEAEYLRAVEIDPLYEALYARIAGLRSYRKDFYGAMEILTRGENQIPKSTALKRAMAGVQIVAGRTDEARKHMLRAFEMDPGDGDLAAELCALLMSENRDADAISVARRSIEARRPTQNLQRVVGNLYLRSKDAGVDESRKTSAQALLRAMAESSADDADGMAELGEIHLAAGETDPALEAFRRSVELDGARERIHARIVRILLTTDRADEAAEALERGIRMAGNRAGLRRALALLLARRANVATDPDAARNDWLRAAELLEAVDRDAPDIPANLADLGEIRLRLGKPDAAFGAFSRIPQEDVGTRRAIAYRFLSDGNTNAAVRTLRRLAKQKESGRLARHYLGEILEAGGNTAAARREYEAAAAGNPAESAPYIKRAMLDVGDHPDSAVSWIEAGLERLPDDVRLRRALAALRMLRKEFARAREVYESIETLLPVGDENALVRVKVEQALALQWEGRSALAARRLVEAMNLNYGAIDLFVHMAFDYGRRLNDHAPAEATLSHLSKLRADDPGVAMADGMYALSARRYDRAVTAFERTDVIARQFPAGASMLNAHFYFSYGSALERSGRIEEAEVSFEKCLSMDRAFSEAWNYLAYMWADRNEKLDKAADYVAEALKLEPDNPAYIDTLGWVLYRKGQYKEALEHLERALSLIPEGDAEVLDHIGDVLSKLGRDAEAVAYWTRAFVIEPDNANIESKLSERAVDLAPLRKQAEAARAARDQDHQRIDPDADPVEMEDLPAPDMDNMEDAD